MINKNAVELLEQVIKNNYENVLINNKYYDNNEFYYEFKSDKKVSENDFKKIEEEIRNIDSNCYINY